MPAAVRLALRLSLLVLAITVGCIVANEHSAPAHASPNTVACSYPGAPDCNMGGGSMGCCGSSMPSGGCCGSSMPSNGCCGSTLPPTTCLNALLCGSQAGLGGCAYGQIFVGGICTAPGQSSSGSACIGSLNTLLSNGCVQSSSGTSPALGSNVPQQSAGTVCINAVTSGCAQGSSAGANNAIPAMNPVGPSQTQPGPSCTYGGNAPPNSQCGECPDGFNTYAPGQSSLCPPGTSCNYGGMVYGANSHCFVCPDGVSTTAMASACPQGTPCSTGIAYAPNTCTQCPGPPSNGTAATPSQCPPPTTCPDGSSHWPPNDPCPSPPPPASGVACQPKGNSAILAPLMDRLADGSQPPTNPVGCPASGSGAAGASGAADGSQSAQLQSCNSVFGAFGGVEYTQAASLGDPSQIGAALQGGGSAEAAQICQGFANSAPVGVDPNTYVACVTGYVIAANQTGAYAPSGQHAGGSVTDDAQSQCQTTATSPAPTLPSNLNTGPNTPYDSCMGLTVGVVSSVLGLGAGGLGGQDFCAGLANSTPSGADPNQWVACMNAAIFPSATQAGGGSSAVKYDLSPDQAKLACSQLVPGASAGGS